MQPENSPESSAAHRLLGGAASIDVGLYDFPANMQQHFYDPPSLLFPDHQESSGITDTTEARKIAASVNHKEAEKRRRQRINSHLDKLRSLLPCNSKTDKATLLAKVIQRVKELKRQTAEIAPLESMPSETDDVTVVVSTADCGESEAATFKASLCCGDRVDLIPEIVEALRSLRLRAVRAEMATLGGRFRNVLIVTGEEGGGANSTVRHFLEDSLRLVVERSGRGGQGGEYRLKRQRF